jgi:hypothetical protein
MKTRLAAFLSICAAAVLAQPAIAPPSVGMVRDSGGSAHVVNGIAGNFVIADTGISNAVSAAFSGSAGLIKTDTELLVLDASYQVAARYDAPGGAALFAPALFAFDASGAPALAYYSGTLFRFNGGNLEPVNWRGDAVAIALAGPQSASVLVRRDDRLWNVRVSLPSGDLENEALLAGVSGPAALLPDGAVVYIDQNDIVVRDGTGAERRVAAGIQVGYFEQMGKDWIALREADGGRLFALRIRWQGLDLYQVPEVTQ